MLDRFVLSSEKLFDYSGKGSLCMQDFFQWISFTRYFSSKEGTFLPVNCGPRLIRSSTDSHMTKVKKVGGYIILCVAGILMNSNDFENELGAEIVNHLTCTATSIM